MNFTFEMPKLLTLSDCAIRVMFAKYDHYSMRSRSFLPRVKSTVGRYIISIIRITLTPLGANGELLMTFFLAFIDLVAIISLPSEELPSP